MKKTPASTAHSGPRSSASPAICALGPVAQKGERHGDIRFFWSPNWRHQVELAKPARQIPGDTSSETKKDDRHCDIRRLVSPANGPRPAPERLKHERHGDSRISDIQFLKNGPSQTLAVSDIGRLRHWPSETLSV